MRRKKRGLSEGFSLVEILVVVSIISLLASITLSTLNEARAKARDARRIADLQAIRNALELYWDDHEAYPIAGTYLGAYVYWADDAGEWSDLEDLLTPRYITRLPIDPINNNVGGILFGPGYQYEYLVNEDGSNYDLFAKFETDHHLRCEIQGYTWHTALSGAGIPGPCDPSTTHVYSDRP